MDDASSTVPVVRRAYAWIAGIVFACALPVPVFVQWHHDAFFAPPFAESIWNLPARFGPVLPQLWALPFVLAGTVLVALVGFDFLVGVTRADPRDDAWTSLAWALRGWRGWLPWVVGPLVLAALLGLGALLLGDDAWAVSLSALMILVPLMPLAQLVQALDARNLRGDAPPRRWTACLPPALVAVFAVLALADYFPVPEMEVGSGVGWRVVGVLLVLAAWVGWPLLKVAWLARATLAQMPGLLRRVLRIRVLAPLVAQWLRNVLILASLACCLLPIAGFLIFFVPQAERTLALYELDQVAPVWRYLVHASRFAVAWWWACVGILIAATYGYFELISNIARARLLVTLGVVDNPKDQAGLPSGLRSSSHSPAQSFGSIE